MAEIPGVTPLPFVDRGSAKYALLMLPDPGVEPPTVEGYAVIYVDPADDLLKIKRTDGTIETFTVV